MQEEVTGTMGEVDNSAHARRTKNPGQGEAGDISKRWQLMDLNKDGEKFSVFDFTSQAVNRFMGVQANQTSAPSSYHLTKNSEAVSSDPPLMTTECRL